MTFLKRSYPASINEPPYNDSRKMRSKLTGLDGKVAVVTGGAKGIGYAISEALLKNGASVVICGRDETALAAAKDRLSKNGSIDSIVCDVSDEADVERLLFKCAERFGGLDLLINNAGIGYFGKTVEEI